MKKHLLLCLSLLAVCPHTLLPLAESPTALPFGRLLLMLHETGELGSENPAKKEIGIVTLRAATALAQEAGILILSPAIWQNILFRKYWFSRELTKPGSLVSLLCKYWRAYQDSPTPEGLTQINTILNSDPALMYHFYLWQQKLDPEHWRCFYHLDASLIILIPTAYLEQLAGLLPRPSIAMGDKKQVAADILTQASGLLLAHCQPIALGQSVEELATLLSQAKHLCRRSSFSLEHLQSLFVPTQKTHPLLGRHWNIYMTGHGAGQESICGLPARQFTQFLSWCNEHLYVNCFYYQSCFEGERSILDLYHTKTTSDHVAHQGLNLHFPLIVGALGSAPVRVLMPHKENNLSLNIRIVVDMDLNAFFTKLEHCEESWSTIVSPITPTKAVTRSGSGSLSNAPLLLLPGHQSPTPIALRSPLQKNRLPGKANPGISLLATQDKDSTTPFVVQNQRALLLAPSRIHVPIEMYPYQKVYKTSGAHHTSFVAPSIISLIPGSALHHLSSLTLHDLGLRPFLSHSFIQMGRQRSTKIILIDSLTLHNDLAQHFLAPQPSWWQHVTTTVSRWFSSRATATDAPHITLHKVIIIAAVHTLTCFFEQPQQDGSLRGYKVTFKRPLKTGEALPDALPLTAIPLKNYERLYGKYEGFAMGARA